MARIVSKSNFYKNYYLAFLSISSTSLPKYNYIQNLTLSGILKLMLTSQKIWYQKKP